VWIYIVCLGGFFIYPFSSPAECVSAILTPLRLSAVPRVLVPTRRQTALDVTIQLKISKLIKRLVADRGTALCSAHAWASVADIPTACH